MNRRLCLATCFTILGFATFSTAVHADVVFGNLGANGTTGSLQTTNTGIDTQTKRAQVFTTGSATTLLQLSSITLGAFSSTGATVGLGVFNDAGGAPGTLFAISTNPQTLGTSSAGALVTWSFNNVQMSAGTNYWIVPSTGVNWNFRSSFTADPTQQNASGYSYAGAYDSENGGANWTLTEGGSAAYALSVQAVPEPSTYAMAAIGVGLLILSRRRRKAANLAAIG